jgi:DNA-directed RNA polymerase specialized sigma24 family protein
MRRHYPGIDDADAEDLAGETLAKIVEYFDFDSFGDLPLQDREKRLWAYIRSIRKGVAAEFFALRNPEIPLPIEILDHSEEVSQPVPRHATVVRKALLQLQKWDRLLLTYKAINRWTYREIQEEFRNSRHYVEISALKMRYTRALEQLRKILIERP